MKKIRSLIIDDEQANRDVLGNMLQKHCPSIELCGSASSADEGFELITALKPGLVFLDIRMPEKSGFDLLRMFGSIDFHVIFISAFDQYAIQAFEFNVLDYILKPIDHTKLVKAVGKVEKSIQNNHQENVLHFVHSLDEKSALIKRFSLHHNDKVHVIDIDDICYIQALRGYCEIVTENNQRFISSKTLSNYEDLLSPFSHFLRVNKSVLINIHYIKDYTKGMECMITIKNSSSEIEVSRRKKTNIIQYLKTYL
jgi:two-component system LytT family response regulator